MRSLLLLSLTLAACSSGTPVTVQLNLVEDGQTVGCSGSFWGIGNLDIEIEDQDGHNVVRDQVACTGSVTYELDPGDYTVIVTAWNDPLVVAPRIEGVGSQSFTAGDPGPTTVTVVVPIDED